MKVAVLVITYKRPQGLARLLSSLAEQKFRPEREVNVSVIVVDNDAEASGRQVIDEMQADYPWPITYAVEPARGIPHARNHTFRLARDEHEFVVFVDDDEVAQPNWLDELVAVQARYGADTVSGPVYPRYMSQPPNWVTCGGFFHRTDYGKIKTGEVLTYERVQTNNLLIRTSTLRQLEGPFDVRYALTGGTDTLLGIRLYKMGCKMVWAADAVVHEWIPESRLGSRWLLQRSYRNGMMTSVFDLEFVSRTQSRLHRFVMGMGRALIGSSLTAVTLPMLAFGKSHIPLRSTCIVARGMGMVAGALGGSYEEYRRVHDV
jgi:succinoglycan biosynthesis protein ExoM